MSTNKGDLILILDYLDGRLPVEEMLAFEIRMGDDTELAAACESFAAMDELEREMALGQPKADAGPTRFRFLRGGLGLASVAAAAIVVVCVGLYFTREQPGSVPMRVAVLRSEVGLTDFNRELQLTPDWIGVDPSLSRGGAEEGPSAREYFEHVEPLQEQRLQAALLETEPASPMAFFNLVLHPAEPSSVVVLLMGADGTVFGAEGHPYRVAFPTEGAWNSESSRLPGDTLAVLPARNLTWNASGEGSVNYDPGFLVPIGSETILALVGQRAAPLDEALRVTLDEVLQDLSSAAPDPATTQARLRAWLDQAQFELQVFLIEELPG